MKRPSLKILVTLLALSVLILFGWTLRRGLHFYKEEGQKVQEKKNHEKGYMENIHLTSTREGKVVWALDASRAQLVGKTIHLWNVKIEYMFKKDKPVIITAREGTLDKKKKLGKIWGDVTVRHQGETLKVEEILWNLNKNTLESPLPFKVTGRCMVEGTGFTAKPSLGWVKVKKLKKVVLQ